MSLTLQLAELPGKGTKGIRRDMQGRLMDASVKNIDSIEAAPRLHIGTIEYYPYVRRSLLRFLTTLYNPRIKRIDGSLEYEVLVSWRRVRVNDSLFFNCTILRFTSIQLLQILKLKYTNIGFNFKSSDKVSGLNIARISDAEKLYSEIDALFR